MRAARCSVVMDLIGSSSRDSGQPPKSRSWEEGLVEGATEERVVSHHGITYLAIETGIPLGGRRLVDTSSGKRAGLGGALDGHLQVLDRHDLDEIPRFFRDLFRGLGFHRFFAVDGLRLTRRFRRDFLARRRTLLEVNRPTTKLLELTRLAHGPLVGQVTRPNRDGCLPTAVHAANFVATTESLEIPDLGLVGVVTDLLCHGGVARRCGRMKL